MAFHQPVRSGAKADRSAGSRSGAAGKSSGGREIPDKLYFRIGEVAKLCEVAPYVLRFWESEFPQLKPNKGGTGQRLYRRRDVEMALRVKTLLYDEGYTIAGARQSLKGELRAKGLNEPMEQQAVPPAEGSAAGIDRQKLQKLRGEMQSLLAMLVQPAATKPKSAAVQSIRAAKPKPGAAKPEPAGLFDFLD